MVALNLPRADSFGLSSRSKRDLDTFAKVFFLLPCLLFFSLFFIPFLSTLPFFFPTLSSSFFHLFLASSSLTASLENSSSSSHVSRIVTATSFPLSLGDCGYGERPHTARKLQATSAGSTVEQTTS